jgi:preprotein translocase subunit SecE
VASWNPIDIIRQAPVFARQVQAETKKVVWPTWQETWTTALMVAVMTTILGLFFFTIDAIFDRIVAALLLLAK